LSQEEGAGLGNEFLSDRCADIFTLDAHANWDGLSGGNAQGSPYENL